MEQTNNRIKTLADAKPVLATAAVDLVKTLKNK